ncbi:MAG: hypothetical protein PHR26_02220 [Candidatus ainarchaeum sp.]|nr:hypothetical protein [Candidatus ainarchaeum sp.]MDD3976204.1 hypothetical protein [Candidatus ainarchaeum sp.]
MNLKNTLKYFLFAIIILVCGYLFGTIILLVIGIIIALMTIFFIISMFFTKGLYLFANKNFKLFFYMLFSSFLSIFITLISWNLINKIVNPITKIILVWVINAVLFGTFWNLLVLNKKIKYSKSKYNSNIIEYNEIDTHIKLRDIIFMLVIPSIITYTINYIYLII